MELYHSQQQRKLNQNHKVLQQVLIHSPAKKNPTKWFTLQGLQQNNKIM